MLRDVTVLAYTLAAGTGEQAPAGQNVAALSASVSAALLAQFVSLVAQPGGRGVPAPLRYLLAPRELEHSPATTGQYCSYESETTTADRRPTLTEHQDGWRRTVLERDRRKPSLTLRLLSIAERAQQMIIDRTVKGRPHS